MENSPISYSEYKKLNAYSQGYATYMQAAWNKVIPDKNPYKYETREYKRFKAGNFQAMLDCQDYEE